MSVLPDKWGTCTKYLTRRLRHSDSLQKEKWKKSLVAKNEGLIISMLQISIFKKSLERLDWKHRLINYYMEQILLIVGYTRILEYVFEIYWWFIRPVHA